MNSGDSTCFWQHPDWPQWRYDPSALAQPLANVSRAQGLLLGRLTDVGMALRDLSDLLARGVLLKTEGVWHNTGHELSTKIQ